MDSQESLPVEVVVLAEAVPDFMAALERQREAYVKETESPLLEK